MQISNQKEMTKKELENIEQFLIDKEESNDEIEVLNRVWEWIRKIYHTQGKEKLKTYDKNL